MGLRTWATLSCLLHYFLPWAFLVPLPGIIIIAWWFTPGGSAIPVSTFGNVWSCFVCCSAWGKLLACHRRVPGFYVARKVWDSMHNCLPMMPVASPLRNTASVELHSSFGMTKLALVFGQVIDPGFLQCASAKVSNGLWSPSLGFSLSREEYLAKRNSEACLSVPHSLLLLTRWTNL